MESLDFYTVNNKYVEFLKQEESLVRGFSRVPNMEYGEQRKAKFLCGIVLNVNNFDYYVPVSSFKQKKTDNFLIEVNNVTVSSLRFNYMFPIPKELLKRRIVKDETDIKYKVLLSKELSYCKKNESVIRNKALQTYKKVNLGKDIGLVRNSCDFKLLENKCLEYQKKLEIDKKVNLHKEWLQSKGQAGEKLVLDNENLNGFKFWKCDLRYAEIKNCDLSNCVFYADLSEATFRNNKIADTKWVGSDIKDMKTDQVTKLSISETLKNNKTHDALADKLKLKSSKKDKNKEYSK